mmetsp:Transcript_11725/g.17940  ORF Transcript_11725/g.17940 Transcript_11725/m.17940 type:complete len:238 (-) Transcript_11725:908-1621(-)
MARSHQHSTSLSRPVDRCVVVLVLLELASLARTEPNHGAVHEQDLCFGLVESYLRGIPAAALEVHTDDVDSIIGRLSILFVKDDLEVVVKQIDSDVILSGVVLLGSSQEAVGEEEAGDPELVWVAVVNPVLEPFKTLQQVLDIASQGLQRRVADGKPHFGDLAVLEVVEGGFKVGREEDLSLDGLLEVFKGVPDGANETIEATELLGQHCVHTLLVGNGVLLLSCLNIELLWHFSKD